MSYPVLLITRDSRLEERWRRALPPELDLTLVTAAQVLASPDPRGWLLIGVDARAEAPPAAVAPLLWLGRPAAAGAWRAAGAGIVDYLEPEGPVSKLSFVLQRHLAAAYLRHVRRCARVAGDADGIRRDLNNTVTAILGNAELALAQSHDGGRAVRRPPLSLDGRLSRIASLSAHLRELVRQQEELGGEPG